MSVLLSFISFLLVTAAADRTIVPNSASTAIAYWQTMLPNSPMPSAILELLTPSAEGDDQKIPLTFWGPNTKGDDQKIPLTFWGPDTKGGDQKIPLTFWGPDTKGDDQNIPLTFWGPDTKGGDQKIPYTFWGPDTKGDKGDDEKMRHGLQGINKKGAASSRGDDQKDPCPFPFPFCFEIWGPNTKGDDEKMRHGLQRINKKGATSSKELGCYSLQGINKKGAGSSRGDDQKDPCPLPFPFCFKIWGPNTKGDDEKMRHGLQGINKKGAGSSRDGHDHVHGDSHSHGHFNLANLIFLEDVLIPGSTITPYLQPATSRAPLLHREVADSIPMSTKNFTDILQMFAPASLAMADDIWSTLDLCEHPRYALKGEKRACATSIESMVEFVMSVLGTHDVQTFSNDVPAEGVASRRYKVAAVRTLTDSGDTMTCHGRTFPFAVFYCHAVNPTRTYTVTLENEDGGAHKMEALAVCHLDTSQFDPMKMPLHVKPGDAAVCHFISRDSVLWAPAAGTHGDGQVAAAQ